MMPLVPKHETNLLGASASAAIIRSPSFSRSSSSTMITISPRHG